ncbi:2-octaprenyl-6-methoxyphenol hydroxylase [Paracoccus halophilus]|uniref:2-octaprenyl-6-methoxyphenol hydroxylase n=1 Tax=Paracoccus halophilus TaxID=376733 RepID=A0A099F6L2_9RHOB|nr:UbiH/UbiF family hydroxylase [Paracoccus halophilus]KGJ06074.1 2-octaprenyl-6-methoxyphenyl hydroxylase [Paracoccus halophilus]SFA46402.1 2-octaprenyl-6-methoxyphenol hydroxylase [Paracoccus halophilus]
MADCDIFISGGGIAGMIAAAAFGSAGYQVTCVDPAAPISEETARGADLRSTAFLQPSIAALSAAGLWERLAPHATALRVMRIIDAGGKLSQARLTREFDASEISDQPFGWNLPNWLLKREIPARLAQLPGVRFLPGIGTATLLARDSEALVTLTDGSRLRARLVIGADGRASPVRRALGIGTRTLRYGQKALAFAVTHERPHENVSTEVHRSGGPFTLVPLPDRDGRPSSAVVWMERGAETGRLRALPRAEFELEMNRRSAGVLGHLSQATQLTEWPIISQIADRFTGPRTALIAEAAHVVPPIGAQGLNMSLADLTSLIALSAGDPGSRESLDAYARRRRPEAMARLLGIDALNRASMISARPLRDLRAATLGALYAAAPIRRVMMRAGLGAA